MNDKWNGITNRNKLVFECDLFFGNKSIESVVSQFGQTNTALKHWFRRQNNRNRIFQIHLRVHWNSKAEALWLGNYWSALSLALSLYKDSQSPAVSEWRTGRKRARDEWQLRTGSRRRLLSPTLSQRWFAIRWTDPPNKNCVRRALVRQNSWWALKRQVIHLLLLAIVRLVLSSPEPFPIVCAVSAHTELLSLSSVVFGVFFSSKTSSSSVGSAFDFSSGSVLVWLPDCQLWANASEASVLSTSSVHHSITRCVDQKVLSECLSYEGQWESQWIVRYVWVNIEITSLSDYCFNKEWQKSPTKTSPNG